MTKGDAGQSPIAQHRVSLREIRLDDAEIVASLQAANRPHVSAWDPERPRSFYTPAGQRQRIQDALVDRGQGLCHPSVILVDGEVAGQITLSGVVASPAFRKSTLGYWVARPWWGRGVASEAVHQLVLQASTTLSLHRLEAHTRLENVASQRVLQKNGFTRWGVAREHIFIEGAWRDEIFWERIVP
ncbi:GNAT family N-acetyltransferase [Micrococcales bacterium 31B]|nr:GNAT family N-acetyltransferase [Micrococcales bacterium 31B]